MLKLQFHISYSCFGNTEEEKRSQNKIIKKYIKDTEQSQKRKM